MSEQIDIRTEILNYLDREPFFPFTIVMAGGHKYEVVTAGSASVGHNAVVFFPRRKPGHSILRLNQISSIDAPETASRTAK
jgi:hypothetical protein